MRSVIVLGIALLITLPAQAGLGVGARVGTPGIGLDVTKSLIPMLNARAGFSYFSLGFDRTDDGIDYNYDLGLSSAQFLLDYHPMPLLGFRLSGGFLYNGNELTMTAESQDDYEIGDQTYTAAEIGTLTGTVDFSSFAPYLGIGWGNAAGSRIGFTTDLGVVFQGSPEAGLSINGLAAENPELIQDLIDEATALEDDLSSFKYYPVFSIGVSVKLSVI